MRCALLFSIAMTANLNKMTQFSDENNAKEIDYECVEKFKVDSAKKFKVSLKHCIHLYLMFQRRIQCQKFLKSSKKG